MHPGVFEKLCFIAKKEAGINLKSGKEALVAARVARRLRMLDLPDEAAYLNFLSNDRSGDELTSFLDAVSTNYTSFMREKDHFVAFEQIVSAKSSERRPAMRVWCAASATGEEPYSIVITLLEGMKGRPCDFKLLATDISTRALNLAIEGCYPEKTLEPLSTAQRATYFNRNVSSSKDVTYEVKPELKAQIVFRRLNLSAPPFPMKGPFDVVFCRNVMIYFDTGVRQGLKSEIERTLAPGGTLFTGHSETLAGIDTDLRMIRPSVYRKPEYRTDARS